MRRREQAMLPINTKRAGAEFKRALSLISAGRLDAAREILMRLSKAVPEKAEVPFQLARLATLTGAPAEAADWLERAERLKPGEPAILKARIAAEQAAGNADAALAAFDRLARCDPKSLSPMADKAVYLQQIGRFDEAGRVLKRLIRRAPHDGELFRILVATEKVKPGDPLLKQMLKAHAEPRLTGLKRAHLDFALAKAFEDIGEFDRVMPHLKAANAAMRAAHPWDIGQRRAEVDRVLGAFRGQTIAPHPGGDGGFRPIFVTGMPRSGTTLVEQILASHSEVTGGGELGFATRMADALLFPPGRPGRRFADLKAADLDRYAARVEARMRREIAFDRIVTDKSMQSYLMTGLLGRALPGARVLIVDRDPRDMLLSIYRNVFEPKQHPYAYDMEDLARYYVIFREVLEFWQDTAPACFASVGYDALVADPGPRIRALVAEAGLDWQDACLNFHETDRPVRTVSLHQVRQPIYRSSVAAWRRYEKDLTPMFDILDKAGLLPA